LNINLAAVGVSQSDAGFLGCAMTLAGCAAAVAAGALADAFAGRLKQMAVVASALACVAFLYFALLLSGAAPGGTAALYLSGILGGVFLNCSIPLFFELALEVAFPDIPEVRVWAGGRAGVLVLGDGCAGWWVGGRCSPAVCVYAARGRLTRPWLALSCVVGPSFLPACLPASCLLSSRLPPARRWPPPGWSRW
jgi:hypothetical protein